MTRDFKLCAPCLLGVEGLVAEELREMGALDVEPQNGRVIFHGDFQLLARANLRSRFSERIQVLLGCFSARTFEELFQGVRAIPWGDWIGQKDAFPVKGRTLNSTLSSLPACQSIIKKAVIEKLKEKYHLSWFEETGAKMQIQFLIMKDEVLILLDTSGAGLHKRGYRVNSTQAPIKETIAAALAKLARVRGDSTVYDPFCGSGTLLIESAMLALNMAPGMGRRFAAEYWKHLVPEQVWRGERELALSGIWRDRPFHAYGSDIDSEAVTLTLKNAGLAGLKGKISATQADISQFVPSGEGGVIITNPPYGERLLDIQTAHELYRTMGERFAPKKGWSYNIITSEEEFENIYGRKADRRRKLYNGMIKCQYYMYFKG